YDVYDTYDLFRTSESLRSIKQNQTALGITLTDVGPSFEYVRCAGMMSLLLPMPWRQQPTSY
ncbi:hypothetical protein MLD52_12815, partial [Puniceicoccaceae bacterium K14]|nr:hypothetical protein [Puniceicoccaceae bacterium K14]